MNIIILAGLITIAEFVITCIVFLILKKRNVIESFSPEKLLKICEAYVGPRAESLSGGESQESLIKEIVRMWIHNVRVPLVVFVVSALASTYIWENFYIAAIIVAVAWSLFMCVFLGGTWKLVIEADGTSKQFFDSIWRHGFIEFFSINLLWAMACLNAWDTALVICGMAGIFVAATLETTLTRAAIARPDFRDQKPHQAKS